MIIEKYARISSNDILIMEIFDSLKLCRQFVIYLPWYRNRSALIAFSSDCEHSVRKIKILHPQVYALEETKTAAVK